MAIDHRAAASLSSGNGTSAALVIPGSTQVGDIIVVTIYKESTAVVTPPSGEGYTSYGRIDQAGNIFSQETFWKRAESGDAGQTHTWSWSGSTYRGAGLVVIASPVSSGDPNDATPTSSSGDAATSLVVPDITPATQPHYELAIVTTYNDGTTSAFPAGMTAEPVDTTNVHMAYLVRTSTSNPGTRTFTVGVGTDWIAEHILIKETSGASDAGAVTIGKPSLSGSGTVTDPPWPRVVGAGTAAFTATSAATLSPGLPTGWQADDIHVLIAHRSDNTAMSDLSGSGWTQLAALSGNNTTAQRVEVWWKRAAGGDSAPTVTFGSGTVVRGARIIGIRGCPGSGDPFSASTRSNNAASATITFATITPPDPNTLLLALYAYEDDPTVASQITNWDAFVVATSTLGNDAAIGYASRGWPTANSATGGLTSTASGGTFTNSPNVGILLALKNDDVSASGAVTIGKPALSGTGTVSSLGVSGTGAVSIGKPAVSGTGTFTTTGTGAVAIGKPSLSGSGAFTTTGTGATTIGKPSLSGIGTFTPAGITGTGAAVIGKPSLAGVGAFNTTGTGAVTVARPSLTGSGTFTPAAITGTGAVAIGKPSLSGAGAFTTTGTGAVVIGKPTLSGSGSFTPAAITGTGAVAIGKPALSGAGAFATTGTGALTIGKPVLSGSGTYTPVPITGTSTVTIGHPSILAAGAFTGIGAAAVTISKPTLAGSGTFTPAAITGTGSVSIGKPAVAAVGTGGPSGTGSTTISGPILAGSGQYIPAPITGTGGVLMAAPGLSGAGFAGEAGTGELVIGPPVLSGAGQQGEAGSGALLIGPPILAGVGSYAILGDGTILIGPPILAGVGANAVEEVTGSGGILIRVPSVRGSQTIRIAQARATIAAYRMTSATMTAHGAARATIATHGAAQAEVRLA